MRFVNKTFSVLVSEGISGVYRRGRGRLGRLVPKSLRKNRLWIAYKNRKPLAQLRPAIQLHLGCGTVYLDGYVNIDIEDWAGVCDMIASATNLSMFADSSVDHVFNHALLEHIPPWNTLKTLQEWHRVLKPGCTIQIEVPDLERIYEDWLVKGTLTEHDAIENIYGGNKKPGKAYKAQDHLTGFTFDRLTRMMAQAGFEEFVRLEHDTYHHILVVHARKPVS